MSTNVRTTKKRSLKYEKGLSRPKDANAPKRPLSAYFQWAGENRERVTKEINATSLSEVTKKLGQMWRDLPKDEKSEWERKSNIQMEKYKKTAAEYRKTSNHTEFEKTLREYQIKMTYKPFKKDENRPKRPSSAYMLFLADERPKHPDAKNTEVLKIAGQAWKELSESKKKPYEQKAKKLSEKHAAAVAKYQESSHYVKYLADKKAYAERMTAKRHRLVKVAIGMEKQDGKGSGESPISKRAKKKPAPKSPKDSKKKKSSTKKKKTTAKKGGKKKASKPRKRSVTRKAVKAKKQKSKAKKK